MMACRSTRRLKTLTPDAGGPLEPQSPCDAAPKSPFYKGKRNEAVVSEQPRPVDPDYNVVEPLSILVRWARLRCYEDIAARSNEKLDRSAMNILGTLKLQGPKRTSDLADILALDRSTVSRQVASALDSGLVVRDDDEHDARAAVISLSDEGRSIS